MALRTPSRRDAALVFLGAFIMQFFASLMPLAASPSIYFTRHVVGHAILQQTLQDDAELDIFVENGLNAVQLDEPPRAVFTPAIETQGQPPRLRINLVSIPPCR